MPTNLIFVAKTIGHKQFNRGNKNFLVIATAKNFEASNYCDNEKFPWRYSISTQIILVAPNSSRNVQTFRGDALFQQILFRWRQVVIATP
jgi:hypothetical protein